MCALFLLHGRLPGGTYPLGEGSAIVCTNESDGAMSWELPDPQRDEDFPDDPVIESLEHHCVVLTHDQWMCEDCGSMFPRDPSLGDFPEQAIIEGSWVCVAYVPERTNET